MNKSYLAVSLLGSFFGATSLFAGELTSEVAPPPEAAITKSSDDSFYDKIWGLAKLYKGDDSDFLNEFSLQGRIQLQYASGDSNQGNYDSGDRGDERTWGDIEIRRWRLGFKSKWLQKRLSIEGQINVQPDIGVSSTGPSATSSTTDFYGNLYDLFATYSINDDLKISAGKTKTKFFSNEYYTSSKEILTFERSLLVNTLTTGENTGIWLEGKSGNFNFAVAGFAADESAEFSRFDSGVFSQVRLGYNLADLTGLDTAQINLDWQQAWDADGAGATSIYSSAYSLNSEWKMDKFGLVTDFMYGVGDEQDQRTSDVWGLTVMPTYYITSKLQAVLRYQYASSTGDESLRLGSRYERNADGLTAGGRGDEYQALYTGLNYYLYSHKLKFMGGVEWNRMSQPNSGSEFDGWTWLVGMRMFF